MESENFKKACESVALAEAGENGVGTLKEKSLHATLKYYFEPNSIFHEVKIENFIADIAYEKEIIEIQTKSFHLLRKKLDCYLPNYKVSLVYPIIDTRYIHWSDKETGEIISVRKSPKKERYNHAFSELYKIKSYLKHKNLTLIFPRIWVDDFRILDGYGKHKKNRATKGDILPKNILDTLYIKNTSDFKKFLPDNLKKTFGSKDYAKAARVNIGVSRVSLNVLYHVGAVKRVGKDKNAFLYEIGL